MSKKETMQMMAMYEVAIMEGHGIDYLAAKTGLSENGVRNRCWKMFHSTSVKKIRHNLLNSIGENDG